MAKVKVFQKKVKLQGQGHEVNKKPLKTVWPDCKAATKFEKIDWEQA